MGFMSVNQLEKEYEMADKTYMRFTLGMAAVVVVGLDDKLIQRCRR